MSAFADDLPGMLRMAWPRRCDPKRMAQVAGVSVRSVQHYRDGSKEMAASKFMALMAASEDFEKQVIARVRAERAANAEVRGGGRAVGEHQDRVGAGRLAGGVGVAPDAAAGAAVRRAVTP